MTAGQRPTSFSRSSVSRDGVWLLRLGAAAGSSSPSGGRRVSGSLASAVLVGVVRGAEELAGQRLLQPLEALRERLARRIELRARGAQQRELHRHPRLVALADRRQGLRDRVDRAASARGR